MTNSAPELALLSRRLDKAFAGTPLETWSPDSARETVFHEAKMCGLYVRREGKIFVRDNRCVIDGWVFDLVENRT